MTDFAALPAPQHFANPAAAAELPSAAAEVLPPQMLTAAQKEIEQWEKYAPTPLVCLPALARHCGVGGVFYKDESARFGLGSFKALGGAYALLMGLANLLNTPPANIRQGKAANAAKNISAIAATDGNHGRSVAWGAQQFGCRCHIFIHAQVSENRADAMRRYGAKVDRIKGDYDESVRIAAAAAQAPQTLLISDFSQTQDNLTTRRVMAGYAVLAAEARQQWQGAPPTHIFLPAGVGGLAAAAMASYAAARPRPRFVAVESNRAACLMRSAQAGAPVAINIQKETIMAGLSCGEPSAPAWQIIKNMANDFVTMDDALVAPAMQMAAQGGTDLSFANPPQMAGKKPNPPLQAGECAVAGWAVLCAAAARPSLAKALGLNAQSRILLIGSEGATDPDAYRRLAAGQAQKARPRR